MFEEKTILITGGTGSLGKVLTKRILSNEQGKPKKVIIFSRDESKQHDMRLEYKQKVIATDEIIYRNFDELVEFRIGDVRDYHSVASAVKDADIIFNAAALKQVPSCEYFPYEAVQTNITGPENIVRVIRENKIPVETVVGISTDKACKPVNVMGMTKALQERIFITANISCPQTRFICVRYGNVLASRGSVIPLFHSQIKSGGPLTITTKNMTRFLMSLEDAVEVIFAAVNGAEKGETYIPDVPSANVIDIAKILMGERKIKIIFSGIRPGEKVNEILISEEESNRAYRKGKYFALLPILPELVSKKNDRKFLKTEFSSGKNIVSIAKLKKILLHHRLMPEQIMAEGEELLR